MDLFNRAAGWARWAVQSVVKSGPVPRHVAFIMDGNRRFADKHRITRGSGHLAGYKKMIDSLEWCMELGITCVSLYAFSIENFKRSPEEVECLMKLAEEKLELILQERDLVDRHGVRVMVLGDLSLLPEGVQLAAARVMHRTRHNTRGVLNICLSYTSRQEMAHAVGAIQQEVGCGALRPGDVTPALLGRCMYTRGCPPVDMLVRTSGETRLSDFMLWQSSHALLVFLDVMWPELSFWDLVKAVVAYQEHHGNLEAQRRAAESDEATAHEARLLSALAEGLEGEDGGGAAAAGALEKRAAVTSGGGDGLRVLRAINGLPLGTVAAKGAVAAPAPRRGGGGAENPRCEGGGVLWRGRRWLVGGGGRAAVEPLGEKHLGSSRASDLPASEPYIVGVKGARARAGVAGGACDVQRGVGPGEGLGAGPCLCGCDGLGGGAGAGGCGAGERVAAFLRRVEDDAEQWVSSRVLARDGGGS